MDKLIWQARLRAQLSQSTQLLHRMAPGMTYGALATATLLPIVEAVKGGDLTAMSALYSTLGGIGVNDNDVRCAVRLRFNPDLGDVRFGFRVVLSPFPLASGL